MDKNITASAIGMDFIIEAIAERVADKVMRGMTKNPDRSILTKSQVCEMLGISRQTLWRWNEEGILVPSGKIGNKEFYYIEDVKRAISQQQ